MKHSFAKKGKERRERNVLLQRTEMNAENKTFEKNGNERENKPFFCKKELMNFFVLFLHSFLFFSSFLPF